MLPWPCPKALRGCVPYCSYGLPWGFRQNDVKIADVLPHVPDVPKPLHNGLEATIVFHRKFEVMVLVKDLEPFIVGISCSGGLSRLKSCCVL